VYSTKVTLSPDAQVLASFAAGGVTFEQASLSSLGITPSDLANATTPAQQFALMQQAAHAMTPHPGGSVSQSDFEKLVAQFGGTKAQADQIFQGLDINGDGSISNAEFLSGLAQTSKDESSPLAQLLLGLMNTSGSGSVSFAEFSGFETAFVEAEKAAT
jgi:Ca2+-binding EF-hand superfamily protein